MSPVLALDIGGSGVRAARVDGEAVTHRVAELFPVDTPRDQFMATLRATIGALEPAGDDWAVGVAFPGFLDAAGLVAPGIYVEAIVGMDLRAELGAMLPGRPVASLPDLAAAAIAEARSPGRARRVLCVGLGTGSNAALAVDGHVVDLAGGCLGDAGHVVVDPDGTACRCGGRGCLESVCSGEALVRAGAAHGFAGVSEIVDAASHGDVSARALLERAGRALGRGLASWATMTFPDEVVVVGGLSRAGDWLLGPARTELEQVGQPAIVAGLPVAVGTYGADAGLRGAALAAADLLPLDLLPLDATEAGRVAAGDVAR